MAQLTETYGKQRFYNLDFMRGIAAFLVALAHFQSYGGYQLPDVIGGVCVAYFFVLSGFVLTHAYCENIQNGHYGLKIFIIARIARLYPLHILTFVLVACYWLCVALAKKLGLETGAEFNWSLIKIFENLTMTQMLWGGSVSFNSPAWSIAVEFWCSFLIFTLCLSGSQAFKYGVGIVVSTLYALTIQNGGFLFSEIQYAYGWIEKNYATGGVLLSPLKGEKPPSLDGKRL